MYTINETHVFINWLRNLKDALVKRQIYGRITRAKKGNLGDYKLLGDGVAEMRIDYGSGYRIYYAQEGTTVYLLLLGGTKKTQERDIEKAKALWAAIKRERK